MSIAPCCSDAALVYHAILVDHVKVLQVLVRWSLQKGFIPLPKSVRAERQAVNLDVFGFELDQQDMDTLDKLECHGVTAWDPISQDPV